MLGHFENVQFKEEFNSNLTIWQKTYSFVTAKEKNIL